MPVFRVEKGTIESIAWDLHSLPVKTFDCVPNLSINSLAIFDSMSVKMNNCNNQERTRVITVSCQLYL